MRNELLSVLSVLSLFLISPLVVCSLPNTDRPLYPGGGGIAIDLVGLWWAPVNVGANFLINHDSYYAWIWELGVETNKQGPCPDGWRLPTELEYDKLLKSAAKDTDAKPGVWTNQGGINGRLFCGKLFLPAAGYNGGDTVDNAGYYWSSTKINNYISNFLSFNSRGAYINQNKKGNRFSVRCVQSK